VYSWWVFRGPDIQLTFLIKGVSEKEEILKQMLVCQAKERM
jgi:hypothetical protein